MTISLNKAANQRLTFVSGAKFFEVYLRMFRGAMYVRVDVDGETITAGRRVVIGIDMIPTNALRSVYGSLVMRSQYGGNEMDIKRYNDDVYLEYTPIEG